MVLAWEADRDPARAEINGAAAALLGAPDCDVAAMAKMWLRRAERPAQQAAAGVGRLIGMGPTLFPVVSIHNSPVTMHRHFCA